MRLIWFFLMGMIAGAIGWHLLIMWLGKRIRQKQLNDAFKRREDKHD